MANYSRYSSVRVYRRYCFGAIFSGILSLGVAAIFAALLMLPMFQLKVQESEGVVNTINVTGLQFSMYALRTYVKVPNLPDFLVYNDFLKFSEYLSAYSGSNPLLKMIGDNHPYVELVVFALFALAVIFALVVGICGLVFVLAGRLSNPKMALSFTRTSLILTIIFAGLLYLYMFFAQQMIDDVVKNGAPKAAIAFSLMPLLLLAGLFVLTIIIHITYSASFKNKVFAGRKKRNDGAPESPQYSGQQNMSYQQMNAQSPYGANMYQQPQMQQMNQNGPTALPPDLREIGDHAFSKCLSLRDATIPQGVINIGPSAFSNCLNLETVVIPLSVKDIGYNCFFNTPNMKRIVYQGRVEDFNRITKGSNWLTRSGVNIVEAVDGKIAVNTQ